VKLREERRQRVFENRVLRRIFGPKRDEVTCLLHNTPKEFGRIKCKDYSAYLAYATFQYLQIIIVK
jgi:hypothetical protein